MTLTLRRRIGTFFACMGMVCCGAANAQVNVTTYHNDTARTGQYTQETILTPANVNSTQFGKLFNVPVDGYVYSQPLFLSNVNIGGGTHNVVYVATEHDSVYAMDADNGTVYWSLSLIAAGGTTVNSSTDLGCDDLVPEIGITSTPVIDAATGTIYVVAKSMVGGNAVQYLHALDVTNGAEKFGGPTLITATFTSGPTTVHFDPKWQMNRAALLLENGHVVIAFGSHCDINTWYGWVMSYGATSLAQEAVFNTAPTAPAPAGNGIWMGGSGVASDAAGNLYFSTGNGLWDGGPNYGDSLVKLGPPSGGGFPVLDYFTPYNQQNLFVNDTDVASGGLILLPTLPSGKQLLVQSGKDGDVYLLDRNNMGKYCVTAVPACSGSDNQIVQELPNGSGGIWGAPAYWNGSVYFTGSNYPVRAYSFNAGGSGLLSTTATSQTAATFAYPGAIPTVSSNGTANGILWALDNAHAKNVCTAGVNCQVLYAYDATNLGTLLYSSAQAANFRDVPGSPVKFATPIIANGKVYFGGQYQVSVFGLLSAGTVATTPTFSPAAGTYTTAQSVTISDTTPSASIFYTTDGTTPTTSSTPYTGAITVAATTTLKAIAVANGYTNSAVASAVYTITLPTAATPTFSPVAGTYASAQTVAISDTTPNSVIYYTTNGTAPTTGSAVYSTPISVPVSETLEAIAVAPGYASSAVALASYTIGSGTPIINDPSGFTSSAGLAFVGGATLTGTALRLTDGGPTEARAVWYAAPLNVQSFTTDFNFQDTAASADGFAFVIQNAAAKTAALGQGGGSLGYQGIGSSVAVKFDLFNNSGEGANSTGFYVNGAAPTVPSSDMTASGVNLHSGDVMHAHLVYDGTTLTLTVTDTVTAATFTTSTLLNIPATVGATTAYVGFTAGTGGSSAVQSILTWTYATSGAAPVTATPVLSPPSGTYTGAQIVTITDATAAATIFYTTNGTTPTSASTPYTGAFSVSASGTVQAVALAPGYTTSAVASAVYTITAPAAATPTFTPVAGTYAGTQSVSIADSTQNSTIYYTTDGSTPTTASAVYSVPLNVAASTTLKALATATGFANSAVATAAYTITAPAAATPTFSPIAGVYGTAQTVTISDATQGATVYYTTNGTTPTTSSAVYTGPLTVSSSQTIEAIAVQTGFTNSAVAIGTFTIGSGAPVVNYPSGFTSGTGFAFLGGAGLVGGALQLTDGGATETRAVWYATPVNVQTFSTDFNFQDTAASADGFAFVIQNSTAKTAALGQGGGSLGYQGIATSVAVKFDLYNNSGEGSDSTGFYTNGAAPITPSTDMTASGVNLHGGNVLHAHLTYDGTTLTLTLTDTVTAASFTTSTAVNIPATVGGSTAYVGFTAGTGGLSAIQSVLNWTYTAGGVTPTAATPSFTPGAGTYTIAQSVTIADTTANATIYYTTDGSTPTTNSAVYSAPLVVGVSGTLQALATAPGFANSAVASAAYVISANAAATPTFSPAAGTYVGTQTVTIADSTANATIYYTTDGSTPTTASAAYAGPITVSITQTVKALAVATGFTNSGVGIAGYTITQPPAATPTFSPVAGSYSAAQSVTIADTTPGATIHYTTDGSTPTTASAAYAGPITVGSSQTLQAIAVATGFSTSAVGSAAYTIVIPTAATPTFSPPAGAYASTQSVTISESTPGATVYFTTNGTTPTPASSAYAGPISVGVSETLQAIAVATGYTNSPVASATYTIGSGTVPIINDPSGFPSAAGLNFVGGATLTGTALRLTDGGATEARAVWYAAPLNVQSFVTDFNFQDTAANADGFAFVIQNAAAKAAAIGALGGGLGYQGIGSSVAVKFDLFNNSGEGADSTGFYANGAAPTVPAADMTASGVNLHGGNIMHAHVVYDGTTLTLTLTDTVTAASFINSTVINIPATVGANTAYVGFTAGTGGSSAVQSILSWTYATSGAAPVTATPSFSPAAGAYVGSQSVTIGDSTPGATIYYTTDGSVPTAGSASYSGPIVVSSSKTVQALATAPGYTDSAVASATYSISAPAAATPTFSPAAGTYAGTQSVTIAEATSGATIYYTTDGSTPTAASAVYSTPISVAASETVKALAVALGFANSAVGSAAYTITAPAAATPTFSPIAGVYGSAQTVTISDATSGAKIYYTTNGTTPTTSSALYSGPITVSATETIEALAVATGFTNSAVATATYTIGSGTVLVNDPTGFPSGTGFSFVGGSSVVGNALQLTDGGPTQARAVWYATPLNVQTFTTDFNFQETAASADGFAFVLQNAAAGTRAVGPEGGALGYQGILSSVAVKFDLFNNSGEGSDSTGVYVNGAAPTTPAVDMTASGVNLHGGNILHAHLTYDGTTLTLTLTDTVTAATFTTSKAINIPTTVGATTAYAGFTAGTGGSSAIQSILNWTYVH